MKPQLIMSQKIKLSLDQVMNVLWLCVINGTWPTMTQPGKTKSEITWRLNSQFTPMKVTKPFWRLLIGSENGDAQDHSVWEPDCLGINNIWLSPCLTLPSTLLITLLFNSCKLTLMVVKEELWTSHQLMSIMMSGNMYFWEVLTPKTLRSLRNNLTQWEVSSCIGTPWTWDVQERISLKITWLWPCSIMLQSSVITLSYGQDHTSPTDTFSWMETKCQSRRVTSSPSTI